MLYKEFSPLSLILARNYFHNFLGIFVVGSNKLSFEQNDLDEPLFTLQFNKIKINMSKFKEIISSDKPTLVDFYATWCGPCQQMSPIFDRLKTKMSNEIRVVKIDVDKNQELVSKFKIRSVPTIILFRKGEIIWKYSGTMDQRSLEQKIKDTIIK